MSILTHDLRSFLRPYLGPVVRPVRSLVHRGVAALVRQTGHQVPTLTGKVFEVPEWADYSMIRSIASGTYERPEISILRRFFRPAATIVELGSNIGIVAHHAIRHKLQGCPGRLICVEPNPVSMPALRHNVQRAIEGKQGIRVEFLQAALVAPGEDGQGAPFFSRRNLSSGLVKQVASLPGDEQPVTVGTTSLSRILREKQVTGAYSLICDIEGGEIPLIFKDAGALRPCEQMVIELHDPSLTGQQITQSEMAEELGRQGFSLRQQIANTYYFSRPRI